MLFRSKFEDDYRQRVLDLIQAKVDGEELTPIEDDEPTAEVIDLAAALEASVAAAKAARERHPTAAVNDAGADGPKKAAKKKPAKKKAASKKAAAKKATTKKAPTRKSA